MFFNKQNAGQPCAAGQPEPSAVCGLPPGSLEVFGNHYISQEQVYVAEVWSEGCLV